MSLIVSSCEIVLYLPDATSLKEKRQILKSLKERLRNKFNIAVGEIGDSALWQKATLGIACVSGEKRNGQTLLDQVIDFLKDESRIKIVDYKIEI